MRRIIPKVAAVQDLSGFGRCSLSVVMPILSCMGIQVCAVPTAVLSTHMGGFGKPAVADLTSLLDGYLAHWNTLELTFECIYSGYLGNPEQIHQVNQLIEQVQCRQESLVVVDPVMGDGGKLYSSYNEEMIEKMRELVTKADLITPNWTEVCFLLGEPYDNQPLSEDYLKACLVRLGDLGPRQVVITGVKLLGGKKLNIAYDKGSKMFWQCPYEEIPVHYPGTGDTFTSVLVGRLLKGEMLPDAMNYATWFVRLVVEETFRHQTDTREGVLLEGALSYLFESTKIQNALEF